MKLLVIVLALLSERFLVHASSHHRFNWYTRYCDRIEQYVAMYTKVPYALLLLMILPLLLVAVVLYFFASWWFGWLGVLVNFAIFYYCIGPQNPFYPSRDGGGEESTKASVAKYLAKVNGQIFALIFWYILLGPLAALAYRLISLCQHQASTAKLAGWLTQLLDWIPARMTVCLYLLAGNLQAGVHRYAQLFFTNPIGNDRLLSSCGLMALGEEKEAGVFIPHAETLVEHALIILLVLLALFTFVAWV